VFYDTGEVIGRNTMTNRSSQSDQPSPTEIQPRYPEDYWDNADEYLRQCFILQHNEDYLDFLVRRVWKLDQPTSLVEFGCGFGKMGLQLMPFLGRGSTYTGIDQSSELVSVEK
jgi:ubiquinone/menaquinone biosynthesis C-methylase UbiE